MTDRAWSPLRRLGLAFQHLFHPDALGAAAAPAPAINGVALPLRLRLDGGPPREINDALRQAPRLLLVDPPGGDGPSLLAALAARPVVTPYWGILLTTAPAVSPEPFAAQAAAARGARQRPNAIAAALAQGQVVWLVANVEADTALAEWLTACVAAYPNSRLIVLSTRASSAVWPGDVTRATLDADWSLARAWLLQTSADSRLTLGRIGSHAEARSAAAASAALRSILTEPLPPGGRLAPLYAAWLARLLGNGDDNATRPAADAAWQSQLSGEPLAYDPTLERLIYEPRPGAWCFAHPALAHHLAACSPSATLAALTTHLADPDWREIIALWAARSPDATTLLDRALASFRSALPDAPAAHLQALTTLVLRILEEMPDPPRDAREVALVGALDTLQRAQAEADTATIRALGQSLADHQGMLDTRDPIAGALALARYPSPHVRAAAVAALGASGSESVRRELRARLADDDPIVARAAAETLGHAGERGVAPLVLTLGDPRESAREMAILGLAIAAEAAIPSLTDVIVGHDARAAEGASRALADMGALGAPVLANALLAAPTSGVADALVDLGRRDPALALSVLAAPGAPSRPQVAALLSRMGAPMRLALIEELGRPGSPAADLAIDMLAESPDRDPAVVVALTRALGDPRVRVRVRADAALSRLGAEAVPLMLRTAAAEPELQGRVIEIASRSPGVVIDATLVTALLQVMRRADPETRRAAARLLGQTPTPQAIASLLAALGDPDPGLRIEAAQALAAAEIADAGDPIATALAGEADPEVRAALLAALAHLNPATALPPSVTALGDPDDRVRKAGIAILRQVGPRAVDPLIEAVCLGGNTVLRGNAIDLLAEFTARAATTAEPAYEVARVWHGLLTQRFSARGALDRTADLGWWGHGREVYLAYVTADTFSAYQDARDLADASRHLYWLTEGEAWLRPQVQEVLRSLGRLGKQAEVYLSTAGGEASGVTNRRHGLQSLEQRLRSLEDALDASRLDLAPFLDVIRHWRELVRRAAVEASGAPDLTLSLVTERVRLHNGRPVTLAVVVHNGGDGAARAVRVSLDSKAVARAGLTMMETSWLLPAIEPQQTYRLDLRVQATHDGNVPLTFRLRYEDAHRLSHTGGNRVVVQLVRDQPSPRDIGLNPYIAGPPIRVQEMFFGRQATLKWVEEQLVGKHGHNVLILYGERRTGKTSVLYHIEGLPRFGGGRYVFALLDLQQMAYWLDTTAHFYYGLAHRLRDKLAEKGITLAPPSLTDFETMPGLRFDEFIRDAVAALQGRTLVIMLDEFDLLLDRFRRGLIDLSVADHIRALIQHQNQLAFIFTGAHSVRAMVEDPKTILFNTAFRRQIGFLAESDARQLICLPVEGLVEYDDLAVDRILDVTHGHPYFIQYICHTLFEAIKAENRHAIDLTDVIDALPHVIQDAMGNIANGYAQLSAEHRVILAALARVVGQGRRYVGIEEVVQKLEEYNINILRRERDQLIEDLKRRDFIEGDPPASIERIGFTMDLVKMWLSQQADHEMRDYQGLSNVI